MRQFDITGLTYGARTPGLELKREDVDTEYSSEPKCKVGHLDMITTKVT